MRIAIMQPYFIPYAGYFRLFYTADLVVVYDCVQFIRRGWIHRNRLPNVNGELQWLTLPLKKAPQDVLIKDLAFMENSQLVWLERLRHFPQLSDSNTHALLHTLRHLSDAPLNYIVDLLRGFCELLNFPFNITYSSELRLPSSLKGENRIIEIAKHFQAKEYINLAGGITLYDVKNFKQHNLELKFLSEYKGAYESILQRILTTDLLDLRKEIIDQSKLDFYEFNTCT